MSQDKERQENDQESGVLQDEPIRQAVAPTTQPNDDKNPDETDQEPLFKVRAKKRSLDGEAAPVLMQRCIR